MQPMWDLTNNDIHFNERVLPMYVPKFVKKRLSLCPCLVDLYLISIFVILEFINSFKKVSKS